MDSKEDILRQILRARPILNGTRDQGEHQLFVAVDELVKRPLVAETAPLDELALVDGVIHSLRRHCWSIRLHVLLQLHYTCPAPTNRSYVE